VRPKRGTSPRSSFFGSRLATIAVMIKKLVILALLVALGVVAAKRLRGD
jgi:hypothetical protein